MVKKTALFIIMILSLSNTLFGDKNGGLIFNDIDTLISETWAGLMDFVLMRPCYSNDDYESEFHDHIIFQYDNPKYELVMSGANGRFLPLGKMNLDSIKESPPDSELVDNVGYGIDRVFEYHPDSLQYIIGDVYIIKTAVNIRDTYPMPVKFKILDFNVIDSSNHEVEMVFLWVVNLSGYADLTSSGLDTFDLPTPIADNHKSQSPAGYTARNRPQMVFKVFGNSFKVPEEFVGKGYSAVVYDLIGRKIEIIPIINKSSLNINTKQIGINSILFVKETIH